MIRLYDIDPVDDPKELYKTLHLPDSSAVRPYVYINMASTLDGKIVLGDPKGTAKGVGGPMDQKLFRRLQNSCDGAIIGATTLRASQVIYPAQIKRFVVTRSGNLPFGNRFFTDSPQNAYIITPENISEERKEELLPYSVIYAGIDSVDLSQALSVLKNDLNIRYLLCEGGGQLNDNLITNGLADEIFITISNKIKGGGHLPTSVSGYGFPPGEYATLSMISCFMEESELYLRYRFSTRKADLSSGDG